jgi:hypothetical protein
MPDSGHAVIRAIITEATGLVPDLPKTVGTGCGVRRLIATTSMVPDKVTCLPWCCIGTPHGGLHTIYTSSPSVLHTCLLISLPSQ